MSLVCPELVVSAQEVLVDNTGKSYQLRLHKSKLYIMKLEDDGSIIHGGELLLEPLPRSVLYGTYGNIVEESINGQIEFPSISFTDAVTNDFVNTINTTTDAFTVINSTSNDVINFSTFFDSDRPSSEIDTMLALLNDDASIQSDIASAMSHHPPTAHRPSGFVATRLVQESPSGITRFAVTGDSLTAFTVGQYNLISSRFTDEAVYTIYSSGETTTSHTKPAGTYSINARLLSPENTVLVGTSRSYPISVPA